MNQPDPDHQHIPKPQACVGLILLHPDLLHGRETGFQQIILQLFKSNEHLLLKRKYIFLRCKILFQFYYRLNLLNKIATYRLELYYSECLLLSKLFLGFLL